MNTTLLEEIEYSRRILTWEDDWDGNGSIAYQEATWRRAVDYAKETVALGQDTPHIYPGPDGSIDLLWQTTEYILLMNVPVDPDEPTTAYGEVIE